MIIMSATKRVELDAERRRVRSVIVRLSPRRSQSPLPSRAALWVLLLATAVAGLIWVSR